jgi:hypothetical protein
MSATPPQEPAPADSMLEGLVSDLRNHIERLERRLDAMGGEITCRGLTVVDTNGAERIKLSATETAAEVRLTVDEWSLELDTDTDIEPGSMLWFGRSGKELGSLVDRGYYPRRDVLDAFDADDDAAFEASEASERALAEAAKTEVGGS